MANGLLSVLRHQALKLGLGLLVLEMGRSGPREFRDSAQALELVISTMRIASSRTFGGSTPKSWGRSPLSTQRQNFRSAVTIRCW